MPVCFAKFRTILASVWMMMFIVTPLHGVSLDDLAAHRAIYDLQLERANEKTGINHLSGRMVYEFTGSACEGFVTHFRYVSRIEAEESAPRLHDQQTTLFESGDGRTLRILNKNYVNRELTYELEANAHREENGIIVDVVRPEKQTYSLPAALFPLAQMVEMLDNAQSGKNFYQTTLYDDFETGDKVTQAAVVVGALRRLTNGDFANGDDKLVWPVTVSYFDDIKNPDGLPSYTSRFLLDTQGVSHDMIFDYGDFSMRGRLVSLDRLEQAQCVD